MKNTQALSFSYNSRAIDRRMLALATALGVLASLVLVIAANTKPIVALAVCLAPLAVPFCLHPRALVLLTIAALIVFEEFPSGMGETAERSTRTPFYATSVGISGLYPPDVLVFGAIALLVIETVLHRYRWHLPQDRIQTALLLVMLTITLAATLSLFNGSPFKIQQAVETSTVYKVNERGASLIALFQLKNFSFIFFSYFMGLLYFKTMKDFERIVAVFGISIALCVAIGLSRLVLNPEILSKHYPLFYHSPSSWLFALTIFFSIQQWASGQLSGQRLNVRMILCGTLMLFILLSFRRTLWAAIALAAILLPFFLERIHRTRYLLLLTLGIGMALIALVAVPGLLSAVLSRIMETDTNDASTLYRLALFVWFRNNFDEVPLFGFGLRPLWDMAASLGYFRTNLENIHSLYFWTFLRTGFIGVVSFSLAATLIAWQLLSSLKHSGYHRFRQEITVVILALFIFLFSGIFNPVYAEIRYLVLSGFALAFISRLPRLSLGTTNITSSPASGRTLPKYLNIQAESRHVS